MRTKHTRLHKSSEDELNRKYDHCIEHLEDAQAAFMQLEGVIGVGYGPKEQEGRINEDNPSFIIYVQEKKVEHDLDPKQLAPAEFRGIPTDVVEPGHRLHPFYNDYDKRWMDWGKIHRENPQHEIHIEPQADFDLDHVAVLEIDDSFVTGSNIDFAKATKRFLNNHPDAFDFITFYVDTSTGLPGQGSFHSGIYNKTSGLNYYAGSNLDRRSDFDTNKLLAFHSISGFGNYVLLQETGHMWGAFVRNRDTQGGANKYDLLIGPTGQGKFHWGRFFDNDHSPMDYDGIDWTPLGGNQFSSHSIGDDYFHFCPLDLYLMGLISKSQVGSYYVIQTPSANNGTITGTRKNMAVQNVIWAEGERNPAYPNTQKVWRQAFVVLTKDTRSSRTFAEQVAEKRREFTWQFYKATRYLGKVDTTLRSFTSFPVIRDISVSIDDNRAIVGWKTNLQAKGRVNYATTSAAFRRDQAHTEPFMTVEESSFGTSHGVVLTGLTPNDTYYFEVIAETGEGLVDRKGVEKFCTRKTPDNCPPDINNVSVRLGFGRNKISVSWKTDELSDSRVRYGTSIPPAKQKYDPYPTTSHNFTLTGLTAGKTYYVCVESRDAAGNVTHDNNGNTYYRVTIPAVARLMLEGTTQTDIENWLASVNSAVETGDRAKAIEQTSQLILNVGEQELAQIAKSASLPDDDLEASYAAIEMLGSRLESNVSIVETGPDYIDFAMDPDPLCSIACVNLPAEVVARECGYPMLSTLVSKVRLGIDLSPHPEKGMGIYRLSRTS
ncbi:MAG: hypothetical protein NPIRA01_04010 [Nitrospirales bacterium]|nr:MAG: hypothetical protein NPIRA01_04010 [Nitrospirales bacterium]